MGFGVINVASSATPHFHFSADSGFAASDRSATKSNDACFIVRDSGVQDGVVYGSPHSRA
jgi:hypothetical protein